MGEWDVVIDVSNVCWDENLPPLEQRSPVWGRLELVMAAWRKAHGNTARIDLIADRSLVHDLDDKERFSRLCRTGRVKTRAVADEGVLELARDHGRHVITRDHYVDQRRVHDWIPEAVERFHCWQFDGETVTIVPLDIKQPTLQQVSAAIEGKQLGRNNLDPYKSRHREILQTRWQCRNSTVCSEAAQWQGHLLVWPALDYRGMACCPTCGQPLTSLGWRKRLHEIVVAERSEAEIMRFPLEAGSPVTVGRGLSIKGVNLLAYGLSLPPEAVEAVAAVSRQHLSLRVVERVVKSGQRKRHLVVTDLGSKYGTVIEHADPSRTPTTAEADVELRATEKDLIVLASSVTLRLSGKTHVTGDDQPSSPALSGDGSPETTVSK